MTYTSGKITKLAYINFFSANVADLFLAAAFIMQTQFTGGRVRDSALNFILIMKSV